MMKKINEDFIKDTATMFADMQSDDIKLNYKDGVYYGYTEGFKKALELVKNNGVLDDVSQQRELLESFVDYAKGRSIRDINIDDDTILYFLEDSNCG